MKTFHTLKIKTYPHKTLNSSKGVIKNKEPLSVFKRRDISWTKKPRCNWHKKNYNQKRKPNNTNKHVHINFQLTNNSERNKNRLHQWKNEKIETYIPNPFWCYKYQKFGHHGSVCNRHTICGKCGEREPNHTTINCNLNNRCANCGEDHSSSTRSCPAWKKEKEILTIKHTKNIPYPEAQKIVEGYIKNKTYSQISQTNPKTE